MRHFFNWPRASDDVPITEANTPRKGSATTVSDVENVVNQEQKTALDSEAISSNAQAGVQKIEATTSVWSTATLILAYILQVNIMAVSRHTLMPS